jgi:hypothetical protein
MKPEVKELYNENKTLMKESGKQKHKKQEDIHVHKLQKSSSVLQRRIAWPLSKNDTKLVKWSIFLHIFVILVFKKRVVAINLRC